MLTTGNTTSNSLQEVGPRRTAAEYTKRRSTDGFPSSKSEARGRCRGTCIMRRGWKNGYTRVQRKIVYAVYCRCGEQACLGRMHFYHVYTIHSVPNRCPYRPINLPNSNPPTHLLSSFAMMRVPGILAGLNERSQSAYAAPIPKPVDRPIGHVRPVLRIIMEVEFDA